MQKQKFNFFQFYTIFIDVCTLIDLTVQTLYFLTFLSFTAIYLLLQLFTVYLCTVHYLLFLLVFLGPWFLYLYIYFFTHCVFIFSLFFYLLLPLTLPLRRSWPATGWLNWKYLCTLSLGNIWIVW